MGKYDEKIQLHFWKLMHTSAKNIGSLDEFKETYEPILKVKVRDAWETVEDKFWVELFKLIQETKDPVKLNERLNSMISLNMNKVKENFWNLFVISAGSGFNQNSFRENYEQIFKINLLQAWELVNDHFWSKIQAITKKAMDAKDLYMKLDPMVKIDIKNAAEAIKADDPDKYDLLILLK